MDGALARLQQRCQVDASQVAGQSGDPCKGAKGGKKIVADDRRLTKSSLSDPGALHDPRNPYAAFP